MNDKGSIIDLGTTPLIDAAAAALVGGKLDYVNMAMCEFHHIMEVLVMAVEEHPELVSASAEVRKYYDLCHFDCHVRRVKNFQLQDFVWRPGQGPENSDYLDKMGMSPPPGSVH